jgi:hypothetical protein
LGYIRLTITIAELTVIVSSAILFFEEHIIRNKINRGDVMPIIKKQNTHLLKKIPTSIETSVPNTTYLERRIQNRIHVGVVGDDFPANPLVGDVWKDIKNVASGGTPIQWQCTSINLVDGSGNWELFLDLRTADTPVTISDIDYSNIFARLGILEGLVHAMDLVYCAVEFTPLMAKYSPKGHIFDEHPEFLSVYEQFVVLDDLLGRIERKTYEYATGGGLA